MREVIGQMDSFARDLVDMSPLMRMLRGDLHDAVEENFAKSGRPSWTKLKPSTIADRQRKGYGVGEILRRTGRLVSSIEPGSSKTEAWVATNLRYAAIHHFGGTIERAPYGGTVRLRTDRRGNLLRQGAAGPLAIFAKDRHKLARSVRFETGPFQVVIPARPYMVLPDADQDRIAAKAGDYFRSRWGR